MPPEQFKTLYPPLKAWIDVVLGRHARAAKFVAGAGFPRLPRYYRPELLAEAKFVPVDEVPVPPLTAMGLPHFAEFENMNAGGITYLDTYFVRRELAGDERLHFHELVHVLQWGVLGPEKFLATYADGLERFGYRASPLETMAYDAEARFVQGGPPFDVEALVRQQLALL